jgi:uncharacterized protein YraI
MASVLLAIGGLLLGGGQRQLAAASAATAIDSVNLRSGPSTGSEILLVIPAGAEVQVTNDAENGFFPVQYDGIDGWAAGIYLSLTSEATTTDSLNLRDGPSLGASVLMVMPSGATVGLTGASSGDFVGVSYGGQEGWAAAAYLQAGEADGATTVTLIVTDTLNLRAGPRTSDSILTVMPVGAHVEASGETRNGFSAIRFNGTSGWAASDFLNQGGPAPVPQEPVGSGYDPSSPGSGIAIVTEDLNLRDGPGTSQRVLTVLGAGTEVQLSGSASNGFYRVFAGQRTGWVSADYLLTPPQPDDAYGYSEELIRGFIVDAANRYGQDPDAMLRVADCESNFQANAVNRSGSYGLFQFVASTWASTPYADNDIFEAWANANAAAWMWSVGRRNEWVCE